MTYTNIQAVADGPVLRVTINRPEQRNALTSATLAELIDAFRTVADRDGARVVLLRGAGDRAFCAGADLRELLETDGILAYRAYFSGVADLIEAMHRCPLPVVPMVHGFALAGGCGLAVAPDITLASDDAQFGLPEVRIGLLPMTVMAPIFRAVGRKAGTKLVLLGERVDAMEALRIGLVTEVVPKAELEARADAVCASLAELSPTTLALAKEGMSTMQDMEYFQSLHYLREMIAITASTDDAREGIEAFFSKRKPEWKGR